MSDINGAVQNKWHAVLAEAFESRRIRIAFNPHEVVFDVTDAAIERNPEYIPDITGLWVTS